MHNNDNKHHCPNCGSSDNYEMNELTLGGNPRIKCRVCKQRFTASTALKEGEAPELTVIFDSDGLGFDLSSTKVMSLDQLLDKFKVDRNLWTVEDCVVNKWDVTAFGTKRINKDEVKKVPYPAENFQIKARLKKKVNIQEWDLFKRDFLATVRNDSPKVPKIKRVKPKGNYRKNLLEINLYDLHLGKLGWNPETGDGHYDHKIAWDRANEAIDDLIIKGSVYDIERILLPWGHDFFNSDHEGTGSAETHAGTPQQNEGRWQKMWVQGRKLTIMIVEKLKTIAPVDIVIVPGNHDMQKMFYLGDLLEVKYENDKNVTVDNRATIRKGYRYGNTLLGLTHQVGGRNGISVPRLLQMMPAERETKVDFAETEFHEWHVGHYHTAGKLSTEDYKDHQGTVVRFMRSLTNADAWHANSGFIGSVKGAEGYVFNFKTGPNGAINHNIIFDSTLVEK